MDSRKIHGEGLAHEQDYIRERLEDAGDVDEYTESAQKLQQEEADLERLEDGLKRPATGVADDALQSESTLNSGSAGQRPAADLAADGQAVPLAAARDVITEELNGGAAS